LSDLSLWIIVSRHDALEVLIDRKFLIAIRVGTPSFHLRDLASISVVIVEILGHFGFTCDLNDSSTSQRPPGAKKVRDLVACANHLIADNLEIQASASNLTTNHFAILH